MNFYKNNTIFKIFLYNYSKDVHNATTVIHFDRNFQLFFIVIYWYWLILTAIDLKRSIFTILPYLPAFNFSRTIFTILSTNLLINVKFSQHHRFFDEKFSHDHKYDVKFCWLKNQATKLIPSEMWACRNLKNNFFDFHKILLFSFALTSLLWSKTKA